jgi:hypothetical protein
MNYLCRVLLLILLFAVSSHARTEEIGAMAGANIALGKFSGVLYYVPDKDGYRVVATVSSGDQEIPLRFTADLAEGQSVVFSVPGQIGEPEQRLKIIRTGDRVFATNGQ